MKGFFLFSLALLTASALARGGDVDNGGDSVTCRKSALNSFSGDYFIDFLAQYNPNKLPVGAQTLEQSLDRIEKGLIKVPWMVSSFKRFRADFLIERDYSRENIWESAEFGLVDVNNPGALLPKPPANCTEYNQAVIRVQPGRSGLPADKRVFRYVPELIERLRSTDALQVSFLLVHEWLWRFDVNADQNSRINYLLHTDQLDKLSSDQLQTVLGNLGIKKPLRLDPWSPDSCVHDSAYTRKLNEQRAGETTSSHQLGYGAPILLERAGSIRHPEDRADKSKEFRESFKNPVFFTIESNRNYLYIKSYEYQSTIEINHLDCQISEEGLPDRSFYCTQFGTSVPTKEFYDEMNVSIGPGCVRVHGVKTVREISREDSMKEFVILFSK